MIIGMRGHDFGRLEPDVLAKEIAKNGFNKVAAEHTFDVRVKQILEMI